MSNHNSLSLPKEMMRRRRALAMKRGRAESLKDTCQTTSTFPSGMLAAVTTRTRLPGTLRHGESRRTRNQCNGATGMKRLLPLGIQSKMIYTRKSQHGKPRRTMTRRVSKHKIYTWMRKRILPRIPKAQMLRGRQMEQERPRRQPHRTRRARATTKTEVKAVRISGRREGAKGDPVTSTRPRRVHLTVGPSVDQDEGSNGCFADWSDSKSFAWHLDWF
ncbi:hypothetical protein BC567DRAFT_231089 [Phyllosticta citribraziliensis]